MINNGVLFKKLEIKKYELPLKSGKIRKGAYLYLTEKNGRIRVGEVAPLPGYSKESLEEAILQIETHQDKILKGEGFNWFPSVSFALQSLSMSLHPFVVPVSILLMGSVEEILEMALLRKKEGFLSAKVKIGTLSFKEAKILLSELQKWFYLRVDVEGKWKKEECLEFFSQFSQEAFDYIEDPFSDPHDLPFFTHPFAVDHVFSKEIETLPLFKAVVYKPTLQGGLVECRKRFQWCQERKKQFVLSSSFESDLGLSFIASMADFLGPPLLPVGIGTYHYMTSSPYRGILNFFQGKAIGLQKVHSQWEGHFLR